VIDAQPCLDFSAVRRNPSGASHRREQRQRGSAESSESGNEEPASIDAEYCGPRLLSALPITSEVDPDSEAAYLFTPEIDAVTVLLVSDTGPIC